MKLKRKEHEGSPLGGFISQVGRCNTSERNQKMWSIFKSKKKKERDSDKYIGGSVLPGIRGSPHPGLSLPIILDTIT